MTENQFYGNRKIRRGLLSRSSQNLKTFIKISQMLIIECWKHSFVLNEDSSADSSGANMSTCRHHQG